MLMQHGELGRNEVHGVLCEDSGEVEGKVYINRGQSRHAL